MLMKIGVDRDYLENVYTYDVFRIQQDRSYQLAQSMEALLNRDGLVFFQLFMENATRLLVQSKIYFSHEASLPTARS